MKDLVLNDLKREFESIKEEVSPVLMNTISNAKFILSEELKSFENNFANFCNRKYCIGTSSGTSAIYLALKALGIKKGDKVITTTLTFTATAEAISQVGATPVFVDIDKKTLSMDVESVKKNIDDDTKAIIAVHLYGTPVDLDPLVQICKDKKLFLIEDCAQAHGAKYNDKIVGSIGDIGCFSFMPAKVLGAYGDGGCVVLNDEKIYEKIMLYRNHGRTSKYEHGIVGYSDRLDNVWAAALDIKLKHLNNWITKRNEVAQKYKDKLNTNLITIPDIPKNTYSCYYVFTIMINNRNIIQKELKDYGISTGIYYPIPLHMQEAYSNLEYTPEDLPNALEISSRIISLPMHPFITDDEIEYITTKVNLLCEKYKDE